jgi:alpha,alpha-trehalase
MSDGWTLVYDGYDPAREGLRETLCTLGNGYLCTRAAAPDAQAGNGHYPGSYLAGGYNRLVTEIKGREVENEDLVNIPNWLPLVLRIEGGPWLRPADLTWLDYRQELRLQDGLLVRDLRWRDGNGRVTRWRERRIVSMHQPHLAALSVEITPENWSGRLAIRSALDGSVVNGGVQRYRELSARHLETLSAEQVGEDLILLRSRMVQSRREIVQVARTRLFHDGGRAEARAEIKCPHDQIAHDLEVTATAGTTLRVEKVVALFTSKDHAISEPGLEAIKHARRAGGFELLLGSHRRAWQALWRQCDIRLNSGQDEAQLKLRLHIFHLLQTVSPHSIELDVGVPPRGWHGEAYRGHIMWDELFIFPFLSVRVPAIARAMLRYRYRRLPEARALAREAGLEGAMFPWQSGSDGREESQKLHLNPLSGRWIPDNSNRQRHVGAAIAYNVWEYYQITGDRQFIYNYGAELIFEIARFWSGIATWNEARGRYDIEGVMGPDEFHTAYPQADPSTDGGLKNNAYTNLMATWVLMRALDVLELLPGDRREQMLDRLQITPAEIDRWDEVSRRLFVPFQDGVISQFEGYEELEELDWAHYRDSYGSIERLDRLLESENRSPNSFKASKQADLLMLFYLFSTEELTILMERLGYRFEPSFIAANIDYYMQRTSHGSTLSWVVHAWVLSRSDRAHSWRLALNALDSDFRDIQGGTTAEGIHLGAMAGTVDLLQRCYTGMEILADSLAFNPCLPDGVDRLSTTIRYRAQTLDVEVTHEELVITSRSVTASPITIAYRGQSRQMSPGQTYRFRLIKRFPREPAETEAALARGRARA